MNKKYTQYFTENRYKDYKVFSLIFLIVFVGFYSIYSIISYNKMQFEKVNLQKKEQNITELQSKSVLKGIENIVSDINYISESPLFHKSIKSQNYDEIKNEWLVFAKRKQLYDQIRYIDNQGNEKIRVNFNNGLPVVVPNSELQNKKDRYYFTDTIALLKGLVYISNFDLNIEKNQIEMPIKPMIRFGINVYDDEVKNGIVVLNYFGKYTTDEFKRLAGGNEGNSYLLNEDGYWLAGEDPQNEWGFMYDSNKNITFKNKFPEEWNRITKEKTGQFYSDKGLFSFNIVLTANDIKSIAKKAGIDTPDLEVKDNKWIIVNYLPYSIAPFADNDIKLLINYTLIREPFVTILMFIISLMVSFLFVVYARKRNQINIMATYDLMTNTYNRNSGLTKLNETISKLRNGVFTICFIDINGLKQVNDILGHEKGDELIKRTVEILKSSIRDTDYIIRLGGDEFLICLPDTTIISAEAVWKRILEKIEIENDDDLEYIISLSHGLSEVKGSIFKLDEIIKEADDKMYMEKRAIKDTGINVIRTSKIRN